MIGHLKGTAIAVDIVDVGGVGYEVACPRDLPIGEEVGLHTITVVKDDRIAVYGFATLSEKRLFAALVKVNGVGPVAAMSLLRELGTEGVVGAVTRKDAGRLSKVKGIGARTANAIVTLCALPDGPQEDSQLTDLVEALTSLGIPRDEARILGGAAIKADPDASDSELVAAALKLWRKSQAAPR